MTREGAKGNLIHAFRWNDIPKKEALEMAIQALEQEPSEDAISRQAVLEYIEGSEAELGHRSENDLVCQDIKELPPVTPQPKTGHWIAQDIHNCHTNFKCSECGYIHSFLHLYGKPTADYTYCPNCGAKMSEIPTGAEGSDKG